MLRIVSFFLILLVSGCSTGTAELSAKNGSIEKPAVDMTDKLNKLSYAAGYRIGDMFQNQKLTVIPDAVVRGMYDARKNIRPALTKAEIKLILQDPKAFLIQAIDAENDKHNDEASLFFKVNADRDTVVVRESGLQYSVLRKGEGRTPGPQDVVSVDYRGRTLRGQVFDNTQASDTPTKITAVSVMPGMAEALQLMKEGAKWEIYVPSDLAYDKNGPLAGQAVIFELELHEVLPSQ